MYFLNLNNNNNNYAEFVFVYPTIKALAIVIIPSNHSNLSNN